MLDPQKQARIVQDAETFITELYLPLPLLNKRAAASDLWARAEHCK
jgi:hypothetical protein